MPIVADKVFDATAPAIAQTFVKLAANITDSSLTMVRTVADLCRERNITVAELAQQSGLEDGRVMAIALGRWTPSPAERQKIATIFGVAIDDIAWGHKTPIQHLYGHGPG